MEGSIAFHPHRGLNPWQVGGAPLIDRLRELHTKNISFAEIANHLSDEFKMRITRNACIGKAERIGLPKRALTPSERGRIGHKKRKPTQYVKQLRPAGAGIMRMVPTPKAEPFEVRLAAVMPLHLSLLDLARGQCRYPFGEGPFVFCGCEAAPKSPYCEAHHELTHKVVA